MLPQLTLISTIAIHHILAGLMLLILLSLILRVIKISPELQSWLWLTAFAIATILPFSLMESNPQPVIKPNVSVIQIKTNQLEQQLVADKTRDLQILVEKQPHNTNQPEWSLPSKFIVEIESWLIGFILIWLTGSVWRFSQLLSSYARTRDLMRQSFGLTADHPLMSISSRKILSSNLITSPMTCGLISPIILLPKSLLETLTTEQLKPVILHENAHIERGDLWFSFFQEIIAIVFWWSPIVRLLNRQIHISRELACDIRAAQELNKPIAKTFRF